MIGSRKNKHALFGIHFVIAAFLFATTGVGSGWASNPAGSRTITFVNQCSYPVWFGLAGGSTKNKLAGSTCNTNADCYAGSTCTQTGSISQCFWNNPKPKDGNYKLAPSGGTSSVNMTNYNSPAVWSGAIAGRTNCSADGSCQTADCGSDGAMGCKPSQGFNQPASQAEVTLSASGVDFYDVEVINGINIPVSMAPRQSTPSANNPYTCGSPGASTPSSASLGGCSWKFNPPSLEYNWVSAGGSSCNQDRDCGTQICGLSFNPGESSPFKKSCGTLQGYWSANQVCGVDRNFGAPFNCAKKLPYPDATLTEWNLLACVGMGSCYQNGAASNCCGCVNWDHIGVTVPPAPYTKACSNFNATWASDVLPPVLWMKQACPTAYTYPFDDMSSTFTCSSMQNNINTMDYTITYCPASGSQPIPIRSTLPTPLPTFTPMAGTKYSDGYFNGASSFQNGAALFTVSPKKGKFQFVDIHINRNTDGPQNMRMTENADGSSSISVPAKPGDHFRFSFTYFDTAGHDSVSYDLTLKAL
jgi:hypothetical protein